MDDKLEAAIEKLKIDCDNYLRTILALQALAHELQWNDETGSRSTDVRVFFGRRFDTSSKNKIICKKQVTPDLAVQFPQRHGVLVEAKSSIPKSRSHRSQIIEQLQKYDDDLFGWDTPDSSMLSHDIVLLTDSVLGNPLRNLIRSEIEKGVYSFDRRFSLVKFAVLDQRNAAVTLELNYGSLSSPVKTTKLSDTVAIHLRYLVSGPMTNIRLYDAEPPYPYLLNLIYEYIPSMLSEGEVLQMKEGETTVSLSIPEFASRLSIAFGPGQKGEREPEIPRKNWVRRALDFFVKLQWAIKDKASQSYYYTVKNRRNPFQQFLRVCAEDILKGAKKKSPGQLALAYPDSKDLDYDVDGTALTP